jgi:tetratricopeptide (TPR) repeat protein
MSAGILLALLPCLAVLAGWGATLAAWVRRPAAGQGLLLSLAGLVLAALVLMVIQVPSVVSDKASYGLLALLAFGAFAAVGLDGAMRPGRWAAVAVAVGLGAWALTAYATHWIDGGSPGYQLIRANDLIARGRAKEGARTYAEVLRRDPGAWAARLALAEMMLDGGAPRDEIARTLQGGANPPELEWRHYLLSRLAEREGDRDGALVEVLRALALDPDQPDDRARLATLLEARGDLQGAMAAWREVLRIDPQRREAHRSLALLYLGTGDPEAAARHREWSDRTARAR